MVKNWPLTAGDAEDSGSILDQEDYLEEETATHQYNCLKPRRMKGLIRLQPTGHKESDMTFTTGTFSLPGQVTFSCLGGTAGGHLWGPILPTTAYHIFILSVSSSSALFPSPSSPMNTCLLRFLQNNQLLNLMTVSFTQLFKPCTL